MPTYEYECKQCGTVFELFQSIKAAPLTKAKCTACDAVRSVRRLIGAGGGVIFKGSGFYQTDYRSESYKKAAKAETEVPVGKSGDEPAKSESPASSDGAPAASKSESKPTSKGDSPAKPAAESKSAAKGKPAKK